MLGWRSAPMCCYIIFSWPQRVSAQSCVGYLRECLPPAHHNPTRWSPGGFCLPPDAHHPPRPAHHPAEAHPSGRFFSRPPIAHQPPPKAHQQGPRAYQDPPTAHQHPPTPLWQLPSTHYRQSQRSCSPKVSDGRLYTQAHPWLADKLSNARLNQNLHSLFPFTGILWRNFHSTVFPLHTV